MLGNHRSAGDADGRPRPSRDVQGRVGVVGEGREMPHLSARASRDLAVAVGARTGVGAGARPGGWGAAVGSPEITEKIDHARGRTWLRCAEWQPAEGSDLLFELARERRVEGEVTTVVGPRSDLVDEEAAVGDEQFDRERADVTELLG